ncbi:MAG: hypothetical protein U0Q18_16845 [Bryobacteraceae bacterium]|jgi:hypothetical protein
MSTYAFVDTYAYTVTHVTDKLLLSIKEIIRESGLSPAKMSSNWSSLERAISTWIKSKHLSQVILEIFNPTTGSLVCRWDLEVIYGYGGDGSLWVDADAIKYHIRKAGLIPSTCDYTILMQVKPSAPHVEGWGDGKLRSTEGFSRYSVGTTIGGSGLAAGLAYWGR